MNLQDLFPRRNARGLRADWIALLVLLLLTGGASARAENLTTKSGKTYENVTNIVSVGTGISFSYTLPSGTYRTTVSFRDLPDDIREKYYDLFEEGLANARFNRSIELS